MQAKHGLSVMALGTLLCSMAPAATHAQDEGERFQERPQIVSGHSPEASVAAGVAAGEAARGNLGSGADIEVQLLKLLPVGVTATGLADLVQQSDRTEVVVTLTGARPDLVSPGLIAEIHDGTCLDLKSAPFRVTEATPVGYSLTPAVFSLHSFGAILPVSFSALRSGAHAITVRTGIATANAGFACVDVA